MGSVYARTEAMKDVFARCHEKTAVQVCTLMILLVTVNIDAMIVCASLVLATRSHQSYMYRI
jgi:hypothetical protein